MFTKIYWIHKFGNAAKLGIMARPRGGEWLADEIANLKKQNVGLLVSLLEKDEINELELRQQETVCKSKGIEFIDFPIADRDIPKPSDKTDWLINYLTNKLQNDTSIVIHCRMGIGRSSIIAASILLQAGLKADKVIYAFVGVPPCLCAEAAPTNTAVVLLHYSHKLCFFNQCLRRNMYNFSQPLFLSGKTC